MERQTPVPAEVKNLHPIVLEIGLGIGEERPLTIAAIAIEAARQILLELVGTEELRHAAYSLLTCARTLKLDQASPKAAAQILELLHEEEILAAIRALGRADDPQKSFAKFADHEDRKEPARFGEERRDDALTIQQLGVRRFL